MPRILLCFLIVSLCFLIVPLCGCSGPVIQDHTLVNLGLVSDTVVGGSKSPFVGHGIKAGIGNDVLWFEFGEADEPMTAESLGELVDTLEVRVAKRIAGIRRVLELVEANELAPDDWNNLPYFEGDEDWGRGALLAYNALVRTLREEQLTRSKD